MIDQNTDFFKYVDNFAKTAHIPSIPIFESTSDQIPEITIGIPTYKRADLLKEAIESAINQVDHPNYDIIVVDNNPERGCETEKLMLSYNISIISYFKNSNNIGMVANWNRLFTLAKGKYVVMLHDDDILLPFFLKEIYKLTIRIKDFGQIKPLNYNWWDNNKTLVKGNIPKLNGRILHLYDLNYYYGNFSGVPSGVLIDKNKFFHCGGFNPNFYPTADYCFNVLFAKKYNTFLVNQYLSIYRIGNNESMNSKTLESFITNDYFLIYQLLREYGMPNFIITRFLKHRSLRKAKLYKSFWNNSFDYDIEKKLNTSKVSISLGILYHILVRIYIKMCILQKSHNKNVSFL